MDILCMASQKGGVGKTTTAVNLAGIFAAIFHKRCLVVDLDAQGHAGLVSGDIRDQRPRPALYRVLVEEPGTIREHILKTEFGYDLLPGGKNAAKIENALRDEEDGATRLAQALDHVKDEYDLVILDCPPGVGQLFVNALFAANTVLVPVQLEPLPLDGVALLLEKITKAREQDAKVVFGGLFITKSNERLSMAKTLREMISRELPSERVLSTVVRQNAPIGRAQFKKEPIHKYDPKSNGFLDYKALADELVQRGYA